MTEEAAAVSGKVKAMSDGREITMVVFHKLNLVVR
jgi:hypothetical protein